MTQAQEQAYYDAHKQDFAQPEQVRLSEILIPTPEDANDAQVAQAQAKADEVEAKLKAGAKFEDMAKRYSGGPTAAQGRRSGDLQARRAGEGAGRPDVRVEGGRVDGADPDAAGICDPEGDASIMAAGVPPLKEIEPQIQEAMYSEQMQPALRAYLTKLREEAYIDIRPGYVDTGASPKQTKPVFTAYAPPPVKKKKVGRSSGLIGGSDGVFDAVGWKATAGSGSEDRSAGSTTTAAKNAG